MWFHLSSILKAGAVPFHSSVPQKNQSKVPSHRCWLALVWLAVGVGLGVSMCPVSIL